MKASGNLKPCPPPPQVTKLEGDPLVRIFEAVRDMSVLANPHAFASTDAAARDSKAITPGTPQAVYQNDQRVPVVVALEAQGDPGGQPAWLIAGNTERQCTLATAARRDFAPAAKISLVLGPNEEVWVDVTDPAALGTVIVFVAVMRLHGNLGEF